MNINYIQQRFTVDGSVELNELNFAYLDKWNFNHWNFSISAAQNILDITGYGRFLESDLNVNGVVNDLFNPDISLWIEGKDIALEKLSALLDPKLKLKGSLQTSLNIMGKPPKMELTYHLESPEINHNDLTAKDISAEGKYSNKKVYIKNLQAQILESGLKGGGVIDLTNIKRPEIDFKGEYLGEGNIDKLITDLEDLIWDSLKLSFTAKGNIKNIRLKGRYNIIKKEIAHPLKGDFDYRRKQLSLTEQSGFGDSLNLSIDFNRRSPDFIAAGSNLQILFPEGRNIPFIKDTSAITSIKAAGNPDSFKVDFSLSLPDFRFNTSSVVTHRQEWRAESAYDFSLNDSVSYSGDILLGLSNDTLTLENLTIGNLLTAWGTMDIKRGEIFQAEARIENIPLDSLLFAVGNKDWRNFQGELRAAVNLEGDVINPHAEVNIHLAKGVFYGVGGYWGSVLANLDQDIVEVAEFDFGNMENIIFQGGGRLNLREKLIDFAIKGKQADPDMILSALLGWNKAVTGKADFNLLLSGGLKNPVMEAGIRISDGSLFKINFDQMAGWVTLEMGEDIEPRLVIPDLHLIKNGGYNVNVTGSLPLNGGEIDLSINASGKLLSPFPNISNFFTNAQGIGQLNAEIRGTTDSVIIQKASVTLENGRLEMKKVAKRIDDIKLSVVLENNFIHVENLSGNVDKVPFKIYTVPEAATVDGKLEPWIIGNTGIKLGVIVIEVSQPGLKLKIPPFSPPDETITILVEGKKAGEKAYIAGPEKNPVVRAKVRVSDGVIDYPHPKSGGTSTGISKSINDLLDRIKWDLEIVPDKGLTYRKEFTGMQETPLVKNISDLFTRVSVDLNVEKRVEGLEAAGIIVEDNFGLRGRIASVRGTTSFLDLDFRVQEFGVEFVATEALPWVWGYATTTHRDTLGRNITITLRVVEIDRETGQVGQKARWDKFTFMLEDNLGNSQEQILSYLGYSPETLSGKMTDVPLKQVDKAFFGAWLVTLERELRNIFGVDYLRINPAVAQNLLEESLFNPAIDTASYIDWRTRYLRRSKITIGKYITDDLFFYYSGQLQAGNSDLDRRERLGVVHNWNLEFNLPTSGANLQTILGYEYDNLERKADVRISIRYTFNF
ncbi:MAG: translocation/assembly module TamB domain-containing protein [FCB group bacterium]|nr:translocation/assembly module TamB domain-containing protein [FCB group bacterium]